MRRSEIDLRAPENLVSQVFGELLKPSSIHNSDLNDHTNAKRRKTSNRITTREEIAPDGGDDYLTLARLDINVRATVETPITIPFTDTKEPPLDTNGFKESARLAAVKLEWRNSGAIDLRIIPGNGASDEQILECQCPDCPELAQEIIGHSNSLIKSSQKITARSSFTCDHVVQDDVLGGKPLAQITIRILIRNAHSLLDPPGLPRKSSLLSWYGDRQEVDTLRSWSPREFYNNVYVPPKSSPAINDIGSVFKSSLYPFQRRAIWWLLSRESDDSNISQLDPASLAFGFKRTIDCDNRPCFISPFLKIATSHESLVSVHDGGIRGGILAEEMGLGKTVEIAALICLHQSPQDPSQTTNDYIPCKATLIVTPPVILQQWMTELATHAPGLRVTSYGGVKATKALREGTTTIDIFRSHDVVLTTYAVLSKEIHHTKSDSDGRSLRHAKKYEKTLSPLTQLKWWRIIIDEAQMIESGVSNAAKVADLIPRHFSWCVSGTPARSSKDIFSLLVFLRHMPYSAIPSLWPDLVSRHHILFRQLVQEIALRHTKAVVEDELVLPKQRRFIITIDFSKIEKQQYSQRFEEMTKECGVTDDGTPACDDWDPDSHSIIDAMRSWLMRLRQTCLHPEVGIRNRRELGNTRGSLRSIEEVLEVMVDQNESILNSEERNLILSQVRRGQIYEHARQPMTALKLWQKALVGANAMLASCKSLASLYARNSNSIDSNLNEMAPESSDSLQATTYQQRTRTALGLVHTCTFFIANAYYQLKIEQVKTEQALDKSNDAELTALGKEYEKLEETNYTKANQLRHELLGDIRMRTNIRLQEGVEKAKSFVPFPQSKRPAYHGGLESRKYYDRLVLIIENLRSQADLIVSWRKVGIGLLALPLVDAEDNDLNGDEYGTSALKQDEVSVYVDAFRSIVSDRRKFVTGISNYLMEQKTRFDVETAKDGRGHAPKLFIDLNEQREVYIQTLGTMSLKGFVTEMTDATGLLYQKHQQGRMQYERHTMEQLLDHSQRALKQESQVLQEVDKEVELFGIILNQRLDFYRQLQVISDQVAPYEVDMNQDERVVTLTSKERSEEAMQEQIERLKGKARYLSNLRSEIHPSMAARVCIICTASFETGLLTSCGHTFCAECLRIWWNQHRTCPTCKTHLKRQDFHYISFQKPQVSVTEESKKAKEHDNATKAEISHERAFKLHQDLTQLLKKINIDGSYGTKVATIARHVIWLREHDPGAKSIIFSQFGDFLDVLAKAFQRNKIGFVSFDKKDSISMFKNDASIECLFLRAKAQSSGLNLVNATHVVLCEPLINTAIESQAIARVHRIGQRKETNVWMYVIKDTVEQAIHEISRERRLDSILSSSKNPNLAGQKLENLVEAADPSALEQTPLSHLFSKGSSGSELVASQDLWRCLFRYTPRDLNTDDEKAGPSNLLD